MNFQTILVPVDFSHSSDAALQFASSLAAESDAQLKIVHVSEDTPAYFAAYGGFAYTEDVSKKIDQENQDLLNKIRPTVAGVDYVHHYLRGNPSEEILKFADQENADLIVIGSHGRTGITRLLLGSVAEEVVRRASCPVLTVKQPTTEEADSAEARQEEHAHPAEPVSKHSLH